MGPLEDSDVMDRVKGGHLELLALLFERHHRRTFGFFLRLCGDRQTAEDLTQDLFLQVLRSRETWQEGRPFLPWLFQIARNLHVSHLRRQRPEVASEALLELAPDPQDSAATRVAAQEDQELLQQALARLPAKKRELLLLSREESLSYQDLAGMLSCSYTSVKVQVHRALQDLRRAFADVQRGTT